MAIRLASSTACDQISSFQPLQDIEKVLVHTADAQNEKVGMLDVRLEGLTLRVASVKRSMEFYGSKLGQGVQGEVRSRRLSARRTRSSAHYERFPRTLSALREEEGLRVANSNRRAYRRGRAGTPPRCDGSCHP